GGVIQGGGTREPQKASRSAARAQWSDLERAVRAPRYDAASGEQAPRHSRARQSRRHGKARPREAALPQSSSDQLDRRALDWQIRAHSSNRARRTQETPGRAKSISRSSRLPPN